jgi:hypothetical protein
VQKDILIGGLNLKILTFERVHAIVHVARRGAPAAVGCTRGAPVGKISLYNCKICEVSLDIREYVYYILMVVIKLSQARGRKRSKRITRTIETAASEKVQNLVTSEGLCISEDLCHECDGSTVLC